MHYFYFVITSPPNGPVLFASVCCLLSSAMLQTLATGRVGSQPPLGLGAWTVGQPTLHYGPVWLCPVRATPCFTSPTAIPIWPIKQHHIWSLDPLHMFLKFNLSYNCLVDDNSVADADNNFAYYCYQ